MSISCRYALFNRKVAYANKTVHYNLLCVLHKQLTSTFHPPLLPSSLHFSFFWSFSFFPSIPLSFPPSLPVDPSVIGTDVTMVPDCTDLTQPSVLITVQPSLHSTVEMIGTTNELFYLGYICEGSSFVAKNLSRSVSLTVCDILLDL